MRSFAGRDILSLKEFERQEFFRVFEIAERLEPIARNRKNSDLLKDKTLVTAFYQPSTRTRLAHEAAMHRLGGHVVGFSDATVGGHCDYKEAHHENASIDPQKPCCRSSRRIELEPSVRSFSRILYLDKSWTRGRRYTCSGN